MKIKFREVKAECRKVVESYKNTYSDWNKFPDFRIEGIASDASQGFVYLCRNKRGKGYIQSDDYVAYESLTELAFVIDCLGRAWYGLKKQP